MTHNVYQIPIDAIPLNVAVYRYIDNDFVFVDFNRQAEQTEQIDRSALLHKKLLEVFPGVKEFGLYEVIEEVYRTGETQILDKGLYQDDRLQGWRKNTVIRLPNQDVMTLYEDLTAIKQLEQEKDRRQRLLEEAQQIAHFGSWTWNMLTDEIKWSDEVFQLFGEAPQSFKPTFDRFLSYLKDADQLALKRAINQAIETQAAYQFEHCVQLPSSGRIVWLLESGQAQYDEQGQPIMMFGVVQDITEQKQNLDQLHSLGLIIDNSFNEVYVIDAETFKFTYLNQSALMNLGYSLTEMQTMTPHEINPHLSRQQLIDQILTPLITGEKGFVTHETRHLRKNGTEYDAQVRVQRMQLAGKPNFVVMANDISEAKKKDEETQEAKDRYQTLFDLSPVGILLIDPATQKAFEFNHTAHQQLGYTAKEFAKLRVGDYETIETSEEVASKISQFKLGEKISFATQHKTKKGEIRDVRVFVQLVKLSGRPALFSVFQDITELKQYERALEEYAYIDPLTQIANRRQFDQTFENEWRRSERNHTPLSLIMIDIDFFKVYNDILGHQAGDTCLQQIAKTIHTSASRAGELTARYGGEEFVVLLPNNDIASAEKMAETIRHNIAALKLPHPDSDISNYVTISAGYSVVDFVNKTIDSRSQLLKQADDALYKAKKAGRNRAYPYKN